MNAPLADLRVIAIEQFGAGPWATLQLSDLGADVIKIEDPRSGGDVGRYVPPYQIGEDSLYFEAFNRGKRSVSLDLRLPEGRAVLEDLVRKADCLFANLRGSTFARLRLRYADLAHLNPRIVCCSLSGFGQTGPRAGEGAYDHVVQALAGWMSLTGEPGQPPARSGVSMADYAAGHVAAFTMLAAAWRARRDGVGCDCDLSLFDVALAQLNYLATWVLSVGFEPERRPGSAHQTVVPFQTLATADGWMVVAAPKDWLWRALAQALDLDDLGEDERFATFAGRHEHREALVDALERRLAEHPTAMWLERLRAVGVPCAPVNSVDRAFADPQAVHREVVSEVEHPSLGVVRHVAGPSLIPGGRPPVPAPRRGEHTGAVLADLCGYDEDHIATLRESGALGG